VQAAATEYLRENVARSGDTLTGGASDTDSEGLPHSVISQRKPRAAMPQWMCLRPSIGFDNI